MTLMTLPISALLSPSLATVALVFSATLTAEVATLAASLAFLAISLMLAPISSVPVATVVTFLLTCSAAAEATLAWVGGFLGVGRHLLADGGQFLRRARQDRGALGYLFQRAPAGASRSFTCSVTSVAYFTTLNGRPLRSRIGLYAPWIHTSRPPLPSRLYSPALMLAATQPGPEFLVLRALTVGVLDEHAVMPALDLLQRVSHGLQEVLVGRHDRAIQLKLDDGLGLADGGDLSAIIGILKLPCGHVGRVLDDFERPAVLVEDRDCTRPGSRPRGRPCRCRLYSPV